MEESGKNKLLIDLMNQSWQIGKRVIILLYYGGIIYKQFKSRYLKYSQLKVPEVMDSVLARATTFQNNHATSKQVSEGENVNHRNTVMVIVQQYNTVLVKKIITAVEETIKEAQRQYNQQHSFNNNKRNFVYYKTQIYQRSYLCQYPSNTGFNQWR
ncbi:hypothetical protein ACTA71_005633 [Dictyostelium dimigraforme]